MRPLTTTLAAAGTVAAVSAAVLGAGAIPSAAAASPSAPKTVTATALTVRTGTLAVGTLVPASKVGQHRTYLGASFGVALADDNQAQYPVQTGNGGRTWRTTGPALHLDAAEAPLSVTTVDAATKRLQYAYGSGQVVDVTTTGGPTWRSALFNGVVMAVVPGSASNQLIAFVDVGTGSTGPTWQYVTRDGGKTWHYTTQVGG